MEVLVLSSWKDLGEISIEILEGKFSTEDFVSLKEIRRKVEGSSNDTQLVLVSDFIIEGVKVTEFLSELLDIQKFLKAVIITSEHFQFEEQCDEVRKRYARMSIPFFCIEKTHRKERLSDTLQLALSAPEHLSV